MVWTTKLPSCEWHFPARIEFRLADGNSRRVLRARQYSPHNALEQFEALAAVQKQNNLVQLYDKIDVSSFERARALVSPLSPASCQLLN